MLWRKKVCGAKRFVAQKGLWRKNAVAQKGCGAMCRENCIAESAGIAYQCPTPSRRSRAEDVRRILDWSGRTPSRAHRLSMDNSSDFRRGQRE
jgi:hypothetical protein